MSKLNATRLPGEAFGAATGRIYKDIGFGGLWNGLPVRIVMIGTLTGLQWMIYVSFLSYSDHEGILLIMPVIGLLQDLYGTTDYRWSSTRRKETLGNVIGARYTVIGNFLED